MAVVKLRAFGQDDLAFMERLDTDPTAAGEFEWQGFASSDRLRKQWEANGLVSDTSTQVVVVADDASAGVATWREIPRGGPRGVCFEIGVALVPEFRGQGIGTEAHRLLVDYLFSFTRVERLEALTDVENAAEQRTLEKLRFRREGILQHAVWHRGGWRDLVLYSQLRSDWFS